MLSDPFVVRSPIAGLGGVLDRPTQPMRVDADERPALNSRMATSISALDPSVQMIAPTSRLPDPMSMISRTFAAIANNLSLMGPALTHVPFASLKSSERRPE